MIPNSSESRIMTDKREEKVIDAAISDVRESIKIERAVHPVGIALGAFLAGFTTAASVGLVTGPWGAMIGMVVGAVGGGLGGNAIAEIVQPSLKEASTSDADTTHPRHPQPSFSDTIMPTPRQVPREPWRHLDETNKDLIKGFPSTETDDS